MSVAPSPDPREGVTSLVFADIIPKSKYPDCRTRYYYGRSVKIFMSEVFLMTSERKDSRKSLAVVNFLTAYADL
jgi:hypothetical protein